MLIIAKKEDSRTYSKKVLYTVLIIEAILLIASSFLKPLIDSSLKEVILLAFILLPILSLLLIIGLDASINSRKRIIAVVSEIIGKIIRIKRKAMNGYRIIGGGKIW